MLARIIPLASRPAELGETEVAMGEERAHAEVLRGLESLSVPGFGLLDSCRPPV